MYILKSLLFICIAGASFSSKAIAQNTIGPSMAAQMAKQVIILKKQLALSEEQYNQLNALQQKLVYSVDSLNLLTLTIDNRSNALQHISTIYENVLQRILTNIQWQQYQESQKIIQQKAEQHIQAKKINYTLLKN